MDYIHDGAEIYAKSFAIIRAESDLARVSKAEERVAVRIIHACGMTEIACDIVMSPGFADLILEMAGALNSGYMHALEPRSARNTTLTSFETFVAEQFVPIYQAQSKAA